MLMGLTRRISPMIRQMTLTRRGALMEQKLSMPQPMAALMNRKYLSPMLTAAASQNGLLTIPAMTAPHPSHHYPMVLHGFILNLTVTATLTSGASPIQVNLHRLLIRDQ